jgi:hypothetical protein
MERRAKPVVVVAVVVIVTVAVAADVPFTVTGLGETLHASAFVELSGTERFPLAVLAIFGLGAGIRTNAGFSWEVQIGHLSE